MGQIPKIRLAAGLTAFSDTAIDMFGPLKIRLGRKTLKEPHAITFTCMTTREPARGVSCTTRSMYVKHHVKNVWKMSYFHTLFMFFTHFSHAFHTRIAHACEILHSEIYVKRVWSDVNNFTHIFTYTSHGVSHRLSHVNPHLTHIFIHFTWGFTWAFTCI